MLPAGAGQESVRRRCDSAREPVGWENVHNVLTIGPPGTGKTLLAKRLPAILPTLTPAESLETTRIYSSMGRLEPRQPLMAVRPFCTPHHSAASCCLTGGKTGT